MDQPDLQHTHEPTWSTENLTDTLFPDDSLLYQANNWINSHKQFLADSMASINWNLYRVWIKEKYSEVLCFVCLFVLFESNFKIKKT